MKRILASLMLFASTTVAADQPRVYIEASETVDASNSKDKAKHVDFGSAIAAAFLKKEVPVVVVTAPGKAQWTIRNILSEGRQHWDESGKAGLRVRWWLHEV